jgi:UPF0716 protein FxsA
MSRPRRWLSVLVVLLLVVPTVEIAIIVAVGRAIGGWPTLGLLVVESALGAWLVRREGARAWGALSTALRSGRMPATELADAALVLVGGTLLLAPGFLTDVVGFAFVLPVFRPLTRRLLARVVERRLLGGLTRWGPFPGADGPSSGRRAGGAPDVVRGQVVDPPAPGDDGAGRTS